MFKRIKETYNAAKQMLAPKPEIPEAQRFIDLVNKYGTVECIPTRELMKLPEQGHRLMCDQALKRALIRLDNLVELASLESLDHTIEFVERVTEGRELSNSDKTTLKNIYSSNSVFLGLVSTATLLDQFNYVKFRTILKTTGQDELYISSIPDKSYIVH